MVVLRPCGGGGRAYRWAPLGGRGWCARICHASVCVARARARIGWRVNRTLAPRRRLREARPRAPAIERPPIPRATLSTTLSLVIPPCHLPTYRHPLALPPPVSLFFSATIPRPPRFISSSLPRFTSAPPQRHYYHYRHHHAPNPYTHRAKLWRVYRYVSLCTSPRTWTWDIYARARTRARIPAALVHNCISE